MPKVLEADALLEVTLVAPPFELMAPDAYQLHAKAIRAFERFGLTVSGIIRNTTPSALGEQSITYNLPLISCSIALSLAKIEFRFFNLISSSSSDRKYLIGQFMSDLLEQCPNNRAAACIFTQVVHLAIEGMTGKELVAKRIASYPTGLGELQHTGIAFSFGVQGPRTYLNVVTDPSVRHEGALYVRTVEAIDLTDLSINDAFDHVGSTNRAVAAGLGFE